MPFVYEALVRGADGQGAGEVLAQVTPENRYAFNRMACADREANWAMCGEAIAASTPFMAFCPSPRWRETRRW